MRTNTYTQSIPRPLDKHDVLLKDFSGGLNNRSEILQDNESPYLVNMRYDEDLGFVKRDGTELYDNLELSGAVVHMDEFKPYQKEDVMVRATKQHLYIGDAMVKQLYGEVSGANNAGRYFFADGSKLYVYGEAPQTSSIYEKALGTPRTGNQLFTVISPSTEFTPLGEEHAQGVTNWDYDTNTVWYEPCTWEMRDTYKGANVVPSSTQYVASHNGRLYLSGAKDDDDNVFISDVSNPFYYPVYLPIQLPPNSDKVRGLAVFDNAVIVGREFDMFAILGDTNRTDTLAQTYTLHKLNTHTGFANNKAHNVAHNYLFFMGADGQCYALSSANADVKILSTTILNKQIDFLKKPFRKWDESEEEYVSFTNEDVVKAVTYFFDNNWHVSIGDYTAVYNYETRAWSLYTGLHATAFYHKNYKLMIGRSDGKTTIFTPNNYLDLGDPYLATWHSKVLDLGDPLMFKHFKDFFLSVSAFEHHASDIRITIVIDGREIAINEIARSMISRYGKSQWGDLYITADMMVQIPFYINVRGRFIQFKISNAWDVTETVFVKEDLPTIKRRRFLETLGKTSDGKYYLFTKNGWVEKKEEDLNQPLKFYQIAGEYELRRRRW
jgi:hypothetical protein